MSLNTRWFSGIPEERKKEHADVIKHSTIVLTQLKKIIEEEIASLDRTTQEDYSNPSWAYLQADRLGQLRAYRKLLALVKL